MARAIDETVTDLAAAPVEPMRSPDALGRSDERKGHSYSGTPICWCRRTQQHGDLIRRQGRAVVDQIGWPPRDLGSPCSDFDCHRPSLT